ncbi:MAG: hypothetical protein GPOALKHO_001153 [Sodalis sp.]|nr:MAG: hypothetical protein GPOALKHO_001153 [Sodalis sp.]
MELGLFYRPPMSAFCVPCRWCLACSACCCRACGVGSLITLYALHFTLKVGAILSRHTISPSESVVRWVGDRECIGIAAVNIVL